MLVGVTVEVRLPAGGATSEVGEGPETDVDGFSPGFSTPELSCWVLAVMSWSIHCSCSGVKGGNWPVLSPYSAIMYVRETLMCTTKTVMHVAFAAHCCTASSTRQLIDHLTSAARGC